MCIQVLEESEFEYVTLAGIINCCGAAIGDAGLEMYGLVVAAGDETTFAAVMPELNQVTGLIADNDQFQDCLDQAKSIYPRVHNHFVS